MGQADEAQKFERLLRRLKINDPSMLQICDFRIAVASGNLAQAREIAGGWTTDSMFAQDIEVIDRILQENIIPAGEVECGNGNVLAFIQKRHIFKQHMIHRLIDE